MYVFFRNYVSMMNYCMKIVNCVILANIANGFTRWQHDTGSLQSILLTID